MQLRFSLALAAVAVIGILPPVSALPAELSRRGPHSHMRRIPVGAFRRTENATETIDTATETATETATATEEVATESATESVLDSLTVTETSTALDVEETATSTDFATATTTTDFPSSTETAYFHGTNPIDQSVFPTINSWDTCNSFLRSNGINLFPNSFNNFDVFIQQVTVIQILIDDRGRPRRRRTFNHFPPPQNYFPEFDLSIQQNNIIAIDANGFRSGSFDSNIGFDDHFDGNGRGGKGRGGNRKGGNGDINDLVKSIIS